MMTKPFLFLCVSGFSLYGSTVISQEKLNPPNPPSGLEEQTADNPSERGPWLTGPLLSPSANTLPKGHINVEPYLYANNNLGSYDNNWKFQKFVDPLHNINVIVLFQVGLASRVDMSIAPQGFYSWVGDKAESFRFGDMGMALGFQLIKEQPKTWVPGVKFSFGEILPLGVYENLDPNKLGTDSSGSGSFATSFRLTFSKLFHFQGDNYLAFRLAVWSTLFTPVHVHGFNSYGGNSSTNGRVHPGTLFATILGVEYTITKHWALALDILASYSNKTTFHSSVPGVMASGNGSLSGGRGRVVFQTPNGDINVDFLAPVGNPRPSFSLSFAPALEYNFNQMYGLILGVWFTACGKNTTSFINGVLALNIYM